MVATPERVSNIEITLVKRSAEAVSTITHARAIGSAALVELVVGLRLPGHDELMLHGYTPTGEETTEVTTWPEDRADTLHGYYAEHIAQSDDSDIDCFGMVNNVMDWDEDFMGTREPVPMYQYEARPGRPLIIFDGQSIMHAMMGVTRPGRALSVAGQRQGEVGGKLVVASNKFMMRSYGGKLLLEVTDQPLVHPLCKTDRYIK